MVLQECNIKPDDTCSWAKDIRTIIKHSIENYDKLLEESENTPDEEDLNLSGCLVGDAIEFRHEAFYPADYIAPHTFEETKEECVREGNWKSFLASNSMTEEEYKEYYNKHYFPADVA